jgi:hypothetical protein
MEILEAMNPVFDSRKIEVFLVLGHLGCIKISEDSV